jgi:hypothetical protein
MTSVNEMMVKAIETLKRYESTKTGYSRINFAGYEDLRVDEIEMLEFLFENCPETLDALVEVCEKFKAEFQKPSSVSWLVMQTQNSN